MPRPIYTDPEIAGVGLTEAEAREQYGDDVAVGSFPWVANARAVMQNETVGWVKSIHETRYGELLGLVMVGPHVTDLIEAGVVALDAEATVETVADGMARAPDALRGDQGSGPRGARPGHPHPEPQARDRKDLRGDQRRAMLSKRKALIGYGIYTLGKPLAKRKLRQQQAESARKKKIAGGVAAATAAAVATFGGLVFWRKRRSGGAESTGS